MAGFVLTPPLRGKQTNKLYSSHYPGRLARNPTQHKLPTIVHGRKAVPRDISLSYIQLVMHAVVGVMVVLGSLIASEGVSSAR